MLKGLFKSKREKQEANPSPAEAVQKLNEVKAMLNEKVKYLELKLEEELKIMRENESRDTPIIIGAMNRKRRIENQLAQVQCTIKTVESQIGALQKSMANIKVLQAMNKAAKVTKDSTAIKQDDQEPTKDEGLGTISVLLLLFPVPIPLSNLMRQKIMQQMKKRKITLKRKKRSEAQLQTDGTLKTLETQRMSLENANTNVEVLKSMKYGADALKVAQQRIGDPDNVADLMDDIREQQELAQEISDIISNPIGFGQGAEDDDELLRELEDLEQEALEEQLLNTNISLPAVPTAQPNSSFDKLLSNQIKG